MLVEKFRKYSFRDDDAEKTSGILNPYEIEFPESHQWSAHNRINPWELWHGNLDAEIMFIGQDFSDVNYFKENFSTDWQKEKESPTNKVLENLFLALGYSIGIPGLPSPNELPLFFTNAVLGIKEDGGMAGSIKTRWYKKTSKEFTRKLIDIIEPQAVIVMGKHAYEMICTAYDLVAEEKFSDAIDRNGLVVLDNKIKLFTVAHCSPLGQVNRNLSVQTEDWKKIKTLL